MKLYSYLLKLKARDQSIQSKEEIVLSHNSQELFVQRLVKVFDQNRKHVEAQTGILADFTVPW